MPLEPGLDAYSEIWLVDFEFSQPAGERPILVCLCAREYRSGRTVRLWQEELQSRRMPPYPVDRDSLFVAFQASAEMDCHLALGWPLPQRVLDLFVEFRNAANGIWPPDRFDLLGALTFHDLPAMDAAEKKAMQKLAARGGPWTPAEREALLAYCESDVRALALLLPAMLPRMDLSRAVACRGRFMRAVSRMQDAGIPIDVPTLHRLRDGWGAMRGRLIADVDARFGAFDGPTFKQDRWEQWVTRRDLSWPRLESGKLEMKDETFREMARTDPDVALMWELRSSLSKLRLGDLAVGADSRNRTSLRPFGARSGRNAPSSTRFVFGPSTWLRGLIKPEQGRAIAYVDWSQQEFGIGAALSGDAAMMRAYRSGDPYLAFAQQAGRIPPDGTKQTHGAERELFKTCVLGTQYGMEVESLARRIGRPVAFARELLRSHRECYPAFWRWSDGAVLHGMLHNWLSTVFGWIVRVGPKPNPRSLRNHPCQANGAEMMRLACSLATERGIPVVAPIHDALLVEASVDSIDDVVTRTQAAMVRASEIVLAGFPLRSDAKVVRWPNRYMDDRGRGFWDRVMRLLPDVEASARNDRGYRPIPATFNEETGEVWGDVEWVNADW
jgi:hypothetical protein